MDAPGTVFYLVPNNKYAAAIVQDPANRDRAAPAVPHIDSGGPVLRIGLDQLPKCPPYLKTGELLLHDLSENHDTQLYEIVHITTEDGEEEELGRPQISKTRRQCVLVLAYDVYNKRDRKWIFRMRDAEFRLIPRRTQGQDEATLTKERLAFVGQTDHDRTIEGTMQRLITLGLQSEGLTTTYKSASTITFNPHNTRLQTPLEPEKDKVIQITKLRPLGRGGQGEVHKVVDMYTGAHHACKFVAVKAEVPQWKIYSEEGALVG
ncbi:hypothetical protein B0T26DRAFT_679473 [Lasiosphaeria miniovina]|uniref:Uncharacterized protein n=1 Tax=Lasiosphaeria miniovina TaxID=1954250 RepID=A0AA40A6I2_9PEZI|nr:uncharacterized protein B0T26DRAFT_679473 [Lasiosphaeria miniovina]KAK0710159.1 hypothetical protein B0T26DRAFT_679473 [Lasiosphaeria miniovina]